MKPQNRIWIAWETQRRSLELAKHFDCKLFIVEPHGHARYYKCLVKTISILCSEKPDLLFVQNPSMVLAAIACLFKIITSTPVVVDRHTTFLLSQKYQKKPWLRYKPSMIIFRILHRFTIKFASLTIVTNDFLGNIVKTKGGRPFILPDKIPQLPEVNNVKLDGKKNILFITSFGDDEPIMEAINAVRHFPSADVCMYVTGKFEKYDGDLAQQVPENVKLTGFVSKEYFMDLLKAVDLVVVLTTSDHCMLCGCYEAIAAQKPLITSDKDAMRSYFDGVAFVDNTTREIRTNIENILGELSYYKDRVTELKEKLEKIWEKMAVDLESHLKNLTKK